MGNNNAFWGGFMVIYIALCAITIGGYMGLKVAYRALKKVVFGK